MPLVDLCVVCGVPLRVDRRSHTRYCRSTCRVRMMRALRRGIDLSAWWSHYTARRSQATARKESLASQLVGQRKRAAEACAQLARVEQSAQVERSQYEQTVQELRDAVSIATQKYLDQEAELSQLRAQLARTSPQLTHITAQRNPRLTSAERLQNRRQQREAEQQQATTKRALSQRPLPSAQPSPTAELMQARRALQEWQAYAGKLKTALAGKDQRIQQLETSLKNIASEHTAERTRLTQEHERSLAAQQPSRKIKKQRKPRPKITQPSSTRLDPSPGRSSVQNNDKYDFAGHDLLFFKSVEIQASDELESRENGTGRLPAQTKDLNQRASEAATAARWALIAQPPKGRPQPVWSVFERVLDPASEKYLCELSAAKHADIFMKMPRTGWLKNR